VLSVRLNLDTIREQMARVRLDLVTLFGEVLLILGEHKLIEELGLVELKPEVLWAKKEVQKGRFGKRLVHIGGVRIARTSFLV
jgi:hypothetical protein